MYIDKHHNRSILISEALLNDKELQQLYNKKVEIYLLARPTIILGKDGKTEIIWINESNHPLISKINKLIELRMGQIKKHFEKYVG